MDAQLNRRTGGTIGGMDIQLDSVVRLDTRTYGSTDRHIVGQIYGWTDGQLDRQNVGWKYSWKRSRARVLNYELMVYD